MSLRIAVMNIQSGVGTTRGWWQYLWHLRKRLGTRGTRHIERIGEAFSRHDVDIAILTEVDGGSARTDGVDQADHISEVSGLDHHAFFPTWTVGKRIRQGNCVLAHRPVTAVKNHRLSGPGEPRFLSEALVSMPQGDLTVFGAHTSLKAAVRRRQLSEIQRIAASAARPVIIGGDLNSREMEELDDLSATLERAETGYTFPSWKPRWALDHLLVSQNLVVRRAEVLDDLHASDHLAIIVDLERRGL